MKIAYITTSFGRLSHTFIRREVKELSKLTLDISLFGIRPETAKELSKENKNLVKKTKYLYPLKIFSIIQSNIFFIFNKPTNYFKTFFTALFNEEKNIFQHLKLIYHFFVSPCIAMDMKRRNIQHIHAHFLNVSTTIAMYCSQLLDIPFSATVHSAGIEKLRTMLGLKQKLKKAQFICAISDYNKEYINGIYPCKQKTYIVRCGINPETYFGTKHFSLKEEGKIRVLSIGRFVEKKGFEYLIEATKLLKKEKINFTLHIVGDGPLKSKIKELIEKYNLNKNVKLRGPFSQEKIKNEFNKSDILIVPSVVASTGEKEGIPVVIIEAMAMGVPVIVTRHSGIPELVKDKKTGLLVPEKVPSTIADAIKLFVKDGNLRKRCIENGRKIILEEFNIKKIAKLKKKIFEGNV